MTLLFSTKRVPTCRRTTSPDFRTKLLKETIASVSTFDPFQADLYELQMQDEVLQGIQIFRNTNQWPQTIPKQDRAYYTAMIDMLFQDKNKVVWVRLKLF
jgi:hypothetical protein